MKRIPPVRFVAKIESPLSGTQQDKGDQIRCKIARILAGQGAQKPNLIRTERTALRGLRNNPSIPILRAGKGNATVIMDTADYIEILSKYWPIYRDRINAEQWFISHQPKPLIQRGI